MSEERKKEKRKKEVILKRKEDNAKGVKQTDNQTCRFMCGTLKESEDKDRVTGLKCKALQRI
jgi:hypothetical protein